MTLERYQAKRNFKTTPEPSGSMKAGKRRKLSYVIQKHAASHLHYDFRLELDGVMLSWAVPKGPSLDPADKRLAMHVEDHPVAYRSFEGIIPKGEYGGGTVMVWDRGTWNPVGNAQQDYESGHLKFDLSGEKLGGRWALVKMNGNRYRNKGDPWLLIKDRDAFAKRGADAHVVEGKPDSVATGRNIDEIAAAEDRTWHSKRAPAAKLKAGPVALRKAPSKKPAAKLAKITTPKSVGKQAKLPECLLPMLATLVKAPPEGDEWIHEIKYDGYRMLCRLEQGKVRIYSRSGKDWTEKFTAIAADVASLDVENAWLDGEICAVNSRGVSSFQGLQKALSDGAKANLIYFVFDLPFLAGHDLSEVPLEERKRLLKDLLDRSSTVLHYSPDIRGAGLKVFKQSCASNLEGIISKRLDSTYSSGARTRSWVKVKCQRRQEMVIGGFTEPQGSRTGFGALLLGVYDAGELRYSGKVGTGFDDNTLAKIHLQLQRLEQKSAPFINPPRGFDARGAHWVKPTLVAEIQFAEWSEGGALRHPVFLAIREDKKANEVIREEPVAISQKKSARKSPQKSLPPTSSTSKPEGDMVAGVKISHPDKLYFPEADLSKIDLARYYEAIAAWILPHVEKRPLSLLRCPDGWSSECFYQKHADPSVHSSVLRVQVPQSEGTATYFAVDSLQGLAGLVQWGVIELHPWGSRMPQPDKPDRLIFDFDPDDGVTWKQLVNGVNELRVLLEQLGLVGFLKTTGGKGLHVVVPIRPTLTWTQAKAFTKGIADLFARTFPQRFVSVMSKSKRKGKIFIDYLRNSEGATAIAAYGIRARKNAPVSTPIEWTELAKDVRFDYFNVQNVPKRMEALRRDPWVDFASTQQKISAGMFQQLGIANQR